MPEVRGCHLPDELLYDVDNHTWFTEEGNGNVRIGMTSIATALAGQLVAFTPKKVGRKVRAGKSCATVESGKWVGPAKSMAGGVSRATIPTMAGMVAALSGVFANTYVTRIAQRETEFLEDNLTRDH